MAHARGERERAQAQSGRCPSPGPQQPGGGAQSRPSRCGADWPGAGVRAALATALFRDGELSLARAARVAEMDVASFIARLGRLGIPAIRLTAAESNADLDTLEQWLQSSSPTPAR